MFTGHAVERVLGRLAEVGIPSEPVLRRCEELARHVPDRSAAVRLWFDLPEVRGDTNGSYRERVGSNGDQVWMIVRDGRVVTMMLRRSNQPATPEALRVDRVYQPA